MLSGNYWISFYPGVALLLTFPIWLTVNYLGNPDNGVILASYLGSFLVAGGYLAFRFVCKAELTDFDRNALPPGSMIPHTVRYVSHLTDGGRRHEVNVRIAPLMILEQVQ